MACSKAFALTLNPMGQPRVLAVQDSQDKKYTLSLPAEEISIEEIFIVLSNIQVERAFYLLNKNNIKKTLK